MISRYAAEIDLTLENNTHASLVRLVGTDKRVLELGAASGYMTRALKERGCKVTAIEYDPDAAQELKAAADVTIIGDLNDPAVWDQVEGPFDTVLAGDVLEHLLDPAAVLRRAVGTLTPDGSAVISIPNVGHADLRLSLLQGRFEYQPTGLLDETHLRFFTYDTFLDLLAAAGLIACEIDRTTARPFETELAVPRSSVPDEVLAEVLRVPESETYQFVVRAVIDDGSPELRRRSRRKLARRRKSALVKERRDHPPSMIDELKQARDYLAVAEADRDAARARVAAVEEELHSERALLKSEITRLALDLGGLESEVVEVREQLTQACIGETKLKAANAALEEALRVTGESLQASRQREAAAQSALSRIVTSRSYSLIARYRLAVNRFAPHGSRRRSAYRLVGRAAVRRSPR